MCSLMGFCSLVLLWMQRLDGLVNQCSAAPPEGSHWDISLETQACVLMPDQQVLSVAVETGALCGGCAVLGLQGMTRLITNGWN